MGAMRHDDTSMGGEADRFPATRRSVILGARSSDPAVRALAHDAVVTLYWKPVYKYIRLKWQEANEEAKDLTQGFFARAMEKGFFSTYDPAKSSFRTFLRVCLDGFVANERKAAQRLKRGGGSRPLSIDCARAEEELGKQVLPPHLPFEEFFQREWIRSLFDLALEALRLECEAQGKQIALQIFERYDLEAAGSDGKLTYEALAREFDVPETQVTNHLAAARRSFRRIVLEKIRELTASEEEDRAEARLVFGGAPP